MKTDNLNEETPGSINDVNDIDTAGIKAEKRVLNISLAGSILFLVAEILCAALTHSMAILMDCVYDVAQLVMIGPFLILVPLLYKPATEKRPYGYSQVESLFILIKYLALLVIEAILVKESIVTIIEGGNEVNSTFIGIFELCVSATCFIMFFILKNRSKDIDTPAVKAELFIWRLDSMSTLGVGAGFIANALIGRTSLSWICAYVDPAIAVIIAVILAKEPIEMVIESVRNLILFAPKEDLVKSIEKICREKCSAYGSEVTFMDVIKAGRMLWIEVYFDTNKEFIDVAQLKALDLELEQTLENEFGDIWLELIPDVEEFRNISPAKKPGLRQDRIAYVECKEKKKSEKIQSGKSSQSRQ